ncbi:MAG: hypothetical protein IPP72_09025 [Chitinophagaceae bacterium]|nr:hypothetical protein [Chitinophagaceae bacterium]
MGVIFNTDGTGDNLQIKRKLKNSYPGGNPVYTNLIEHNNKFYGMTSEGGDNNLGVIFEWNPSTNVYIKKVDFNGSNGAIPTGSLAFYAGKFYGMTSLGGNNNQGVIFEWDPSTNTLRKKIELNVGIGSIPLGSMTLYLNKFYGVTNKGGNYNGGVVFEWTPSTNVYIKKNDFDFTKGSHPIGDLTLYRGKFYGMTSEGGCTGKGVIFEWDPVTNIFYKKKFNGTDGSNPHGGLTMLNGDFYGMSNEGGINNKGVIFKWNPLTNAYNKRFDLTKSEGANPEGNLVYYGEKFYGMTPIGGINPGDPEDAPHGQIFEWDPVTNAFWGILHFSPYFTGSSPHGSLSIYEGKLYGMTSWGGSNCATCENRNGVIFDIEPSSEIYTKRISFNSTDGIGTGSLTQYKGKIYGITEEGGKDDVGTISEWDLSTNSYTKKIDLPFSSYSCSYLTLFNSKFYGMSSVGDNNVGAILNGIRQQIRT